MRKIALYIDAENTSPYTLDGIFEFIIANRLTPVEIKAFADWSKPNLTNFKSFLQKYAVEAVHHFGVSKKQTSDYLLQIHAMDALYRQDLDLFAIVSSDQDFAPLILRLRQSQKEVYVFGKENTQLSVRLAATKFICTDDFSTQGRLPPGSSLTLTQAIHSAIDERGRNNKLYLATLGQYLKDNLDNYYAIKMGMSLAKLVEATGEFMITTIAGTEYVSPIK